jgi:excisionase family DNA binding protein
LKRLVERGDLPAYRVGRTRAYRLKTADLAAMFERI